MEVNPGLLYHIWLVLSLFIGKNCICPINGFLSHCVLQTRFSRFPDNGYPSTITHTLNGTGLGADSAAQVFLQWNAWAALFHPARYFVIIYNILWSDSFRSEYRLM